MNRHLWTWVFLALFLLMPGSRAIATESVTFDEVWWNDASQDEQTFAIQGAIDAYENGVSDGVIHAGTLLGKSDAALRIADSDGPTFSQTFGYYTSEVNNFYASHPNASKATIGVIVSCLADKPFYTCDQIARWPIFSGSAP